MTQGEAEVNLPMFEVVIDDKLRSPEREEVVTHKMTESKTGLDLAMQ